MLDNNDIIKNAHSVLEEEANAILEANQHLDQSFVRAVDLILNCKGRLMGTSVNSTH